jgi:hypothetical protein
MSRAKKQTRVGRVLGMTNIDDRVPPLFRSRWIQMLKIPHQI